MVLKNKKNSIIIELLNKDRRLIIINLLHDFYECLFIIFSNHILLYENANEYPLMDLVIIKYMII